MSSSRSHNPTHTVSMIGKEPMSSSVVLSRNGKEKTLLPVDFQPTECSVICGNKRAFFSSAGNRRFRLICQMHLEEFMRAPTKHEKSNVVTRVMRILHETCPLGAFVALEKGRWWEISHRSSREKVGTFFRDCLADKYKSSSKNKTAQRKMKRTSHPCIDTGMKSNEHITTKPTTKRVSTTALEITASAAMAFANPSAEKRAESSATMPSMKQVLASKFIPTTTGSTDTFAMDHRPSPTTSIANQSMAQEVQPNNSNANMLTMQQAFADRLIPSTAGTADFSVAYSANCLAKPFAETQTKVQPDEPNDTMASLESIFAVQAQFLPTNTGTTHSVMSRPMTANNSMSYPSKQNMEMQSNYYMPIMHQVMSAQFLPINNSSGNVKLTLAHPLSAPTSPVTAPAPILAYPASTPNLRAFGGAIPAPRPLAQNSARAMLSSLTAASGPLGEDLAKRVLDELAMTDPLSYDYVFSNPLCEDDILGASTGSFYDIDDLSLASL